ncbi:unnamed protein product [Microthlaspi erraticum]|uniref:Uncharacterized protein n=1 Tax=Microthlaspi erraticum TaxID=1685480 RepID=A0A6D2HPT8_9BRAS|nr:unnamed protein product [Microthlaspi erraticum]
MLFLYNCGELRVGQRSLEGPANGVCELELEPPIQLLVFNEEVGLAKLDVHPPGSVPSLSWCLPCKEGVGKALCTYLSTGLLIEQPWTLRKSTPSAIVAQTFGAHFLDIPMVPFSIVEPNKISKLPEGDHLFLLAKNVIHPQP